MQPRLIAHRGNLWGSDPELENSPKYLTKAINQGFDVEVDLWIVIGKLYLGHDEPTYKVKDSWIFKIKHSAWIHCKNVEALLWCKENYLHYFWHEKDAYTITSEGYIWTYPGKLVPMGGVLVDKKLKIAPRGVDIICSDFVGEIKKNG